MGKIVDLKKMAMTQHTMKSNQIEELVNELKVLQETYNALPEAICQQIEPLLELREEFFEIIQQYNKINQAQRASIETVTQELTDRATLKMSRTAKELEAKLRVAAIHSKYMRSTAKNSQTATRNLKELCIEIEKHLQQLKALTSRQRNHHLKTAIITGLISGLTVTVSVYLPVIWRHL